MIQPFLFFLVKNGEVHPNRPMKNKEESKAPMAREAHAERARRKKSVEEKQPELIPFASWAQSSAVFPGQIKDLGLLATLLNYIKKSLFSFSNIVIYMNRKIDPSIYPIFIEISKKESISFNV